MLGGGLQLPKMTGVKKWKERVVRKEFEIGSLGQAYVVRLRDAGVNRLLYALPIGVLPRLAHKASLTNAMEKQCRRRRRLLLSSLYYFSGTSVKLLRTISVGVSHKSAKASLVLG